MEFLSGMAEWIIGIYCRQTVRPAWTALPHLSWNLSSRLRLDDGVDIHPVLSAHALTRGV
jgi:hypothetical protein